MQLPTSSSLRNLRQYSSEKWCSVYPTSIFLCSKHTFHGGKVVASSHILTQFQQSSSCLKFILLTKLKGTLSPSRSQLWKAHIHTDQRGTFGGPWFAVKKAVGPLYWPVFHVPRLRGSLLIYSVHEHAYVSNRLCVPYQKSQGGEKKKKNLHII